MAASSPPQLDPTPPGSHPVAFATFLRRFQAMTADSFVVLLAFAVTIVLAELAQDVPGSGRVFVAAIAAELLLYEPLMVWRFGATVGHHRMNLRVVSDATGGNPTLAQAGARFLLKSVLGIFSFTTMTLTRRHQAIHDRLTRTTVQIRDLAQARPWDYYAPLEPGDGPALPSRARRILVIVLYLCATLALFVLALVAGLPDTCTLANQCTDSQLLVRDALGWVWLGASVLVVIAGARGLLPGARARRAPALADASD